VLDASSQLKGLPYQIEWFNFPAAQPLGEALNTGTGGGGNPLDAARRRSSPVRIRL
jgi:sulfonate transport system substrate-binding protein